MPRRELIEVDLIRYNRESRIFSDSVIDFFSRGSRKYGLKFIYQFGYALNPFYTKILIKLPAIPIHYNDYDVFKSPLEDFSTKLRRQGLKTVSTICITERHILLK